MHDFDTNGPSCSKHHELNKLVSGQNVNLTVLVSTISNSQIFLLKKWEQLLQKLLAFFFFSKNISIYPVFNDQW